MLRPAKKHEQQNQKADDLTDERGDRGADNSHVKGEN